MITEIYNLKGEKLDRQICFDLDHIVDTFDISTDRKEEALKTSLEYTYEVSDIKDIGNFTFRVQIKHMNRNLNCVWFRETLTFMEYKCEHTTRRLYAKNR